MFYFNIYILSKYWTETLLGTSSSILEKVAVGWTRRRRPPYQVTVMAAWTVMPEAVGTITMTTLHATGAAVQTSLC